MAKVSNSIMNAIIQEKHNKNYTMGGGGGLGVLSFLKITEKIKRIIAHAIKIMKREEMDLVKISLISISIIPQIPRRDITAKNRTNPVRITAADFRRLLMAKNFSTAKLRDLLAKVTSLTFVNKVVIAFIRETQILKAKRIKICKLNESR